MLAPTTVDPTERVVLWCLRRQAEGDPDAARSVHRNLTHGWGRAHGQRGYCALAQLHGVLTRQGRRTLRFGAVEDEGLTPDEAAVLGLLRCERAGDESQAACRVCWLARREAGPRWREAFGRVAAVLRAVEAGETRADEAAACA